MELTARTERAACDHCRPAWSQSTTACPLPITPTRGDGTRSTMGSFRNPPVAAKSLCWTAMAIQADVPGGPAAETGRLTVPGASLVRLPQAGIASPPPGGS
jgi:hypothetical protein